VLGLVEVTNGWQILEGMPNVKRTGRRTASVADSFAEFEGLLIGRDTFRPPQLAVDLP
jgi:hypothetical protein